MMNNFIASCDWAVYPVEAGVLKRRRAGVDDRPSKENY